MSDKLSDADLYEIEQRVKKALEVAPPPWVEYLESWYTTGGASVVHAGPTDVGPEIEMYVDVHLGDDQWRSPDARLDAVIDLFGHAPTTSSAYSMRFGESGRNRPERTLMPQRARSRAFGPAYRRTFVQPVHIDRIVVTALNW
jgi:hypothetical protein